MTTPVLWPVARLRQFGSGLWIVAAGLAVGGTFAPLVERRTPRETEVITSWGLEGDFTDGSYPAFGIPIIVGAVLLVAAAGLGLMSTRLHPASAGVLASRLLGTGGVGVLAASTGTLVLFTTLFTTNERGAPSDLAFHTGLGTWLLIGASVIGVGAIVLMLIPKVRHDPDPETPPMGIPVVRVLEPEYDETEPKA